MGCGWQLPAMRSTTLGTADVPTVSSSGRGDQAYRVAQSAELPEARDGRPSRAAAERLGCGNIGGGKGFITHQTPNEFELCFLYVLLKENVR